MRPVSAVEASRPFSLVEVIVCVYVAIAIVLVVIAPIAAFALVDYSRRCVRDCINDIRRENR